MVWLLHDLLLNLEDLVWAHVSKAVGLVTHVEGTANCSDPDSYEIALHYYWTSGLMA